MSSQLGVVVPGPWAALECVRIPPFIPAPAMMGYPADSVPPKKLDTLGYPLVTGSDAHYVEHVGRRPFELDISREKLCPGGGDADIAALERALQRDLLTISRL
jgi:hypothetical protein